MATTLKSLKTPLRYPGGKSRALSKLFQYIPDLKDYKEYREPFLGGGSVALEVSKRYPRLDIWVNDLYEPLYNFWRELQDNGNEIKNILLQLKQRHPDPTSAKNFSWTLKNTFQGLRQRFSSHRILKTYGVLFLSTLLISAVFRVLLSHPPSQNKQATQIFRWQVLKD